MSTQDNSIAVLRTSLTSPYGRKVRIAVGMLGLQSRIRVVHADTRDPNDVLRKDNPLGKMPVLITESGKRIIESNIIIQALEGMTGTHLLLPAQPESRVDVLCNASLADGVTDAALLMTYERRFRKPEQVSEQWLNYQCEKIVRTLDVIQDRLHEFEALDLAAVALICALGYMDWRKQYPWRDHYKDIEQWLGRHEASSSAVRDTAIQEV